MSNLERLGIGLTAVAVLSAGASQVPEVFGCVDEAGSNRTEFVGGDIIMPHCEEEYMSSFGNKLHDTGRILAVVSAAGAIATSIAIKRSRGSSPQVSISGN